MNGDMPLDVFAKITADELVRCRKKITELENENSSLVDENNMLLRKRISVEEGERLRQVNLTLRGEIKALQAEKGMDRLRKENKALKIRLVNMAKRFIDAYNENRPPKLKYLLELAYFSGATDKKPDFAAFYRTISNEVNTE